MNFAEEYLNVICVLKPTIAVLILSKKLNKGWCEDHCSPVAKFVGEGKNHPESCSVGGWLTVPA